MTYTPRLLLVDNKFALRHLSRNGGLYDEDNPYTKPSISQSEQTEYKFNEQNTLWEPEKVEKLEKEPIEKHQYQQDLNKADAKIDEKNYDFSTTVNTWTDFMYTRYHPKSINLLQTVGETNEEQPFDCFTTGTQVWADENFEDEFCDRIRQYIEECHNCQGFQMLFDCTDAFAGLSVKCLEYLKDEYGKSMLTIPIFSPKPTRNIKKGNEALADSVRVINTALAYSNLIESSSLILPISTMRQCWRKVEYPRAFPHLNYDAHNLYETSAILATYLDTISLRYRLNDQIESCHLANFCSDLSNYGRKLVAGALAMPFQMSTELDLIDCLDKLEGNLFTQISPNSKIGTDRIVQSVCIRGIPENRLKSTKPQKVVERQMKMAAYKCASVSEMFQLYFQCENYASLVHVSATEKGMPTKNPFPMELFDNRVSESGFINDFPLPSASDGSGKIKVKSIPTMAAAQSSSELADTIESLHREASRIKITRIPRLNDSMEQDEFVEALNTLLEFKENYEDSFEL